jgi:hypothetical protein
MSAAICNLALSGVAPRARIGVTEPAVHVARHTAVQGTTIPVLSFAAMRAPSCRCEVDAGLACPSGGPLPSKHEPIQFRQAA